MVTRSVVFLLVMVGALAPMSAGTRRQCVVGSDPRYSFDESRAVFLGTASRSRETGIICEDCMDSYRTSFRVEKVWKGTIKRNTEVLSDASFVAGKAYLIFAVGDPLQTYLDCGWSVAYDAALEKRNFLAGRPSHKPK
jgi:hypothetical protein